MASAQDNVDIVLKAVNSASAVLTQVKRDLGGLDEGFQKTGNAAQTFNASLSSISANARAAGLGLSVGLTAPLALLGKSLLNQVANIEQYKVGFDTLLKSTAKGSALLKQLSDIAVKTPFNLPDITQGARQLLAYSFSAGEAVKTIQTLGDVAAGVGAPIGDLVYLYGTLRAQGRAYAVDIRQFANRGIPIYEELAKVLKVSQGEVLALVSAGKVGFPQVQQAFENMTSAGGIFFDLMNKQSQTFNGIMSNLQDQFTRVALSLLGLSTSAETFGEIIQGGVFDILKDIAKGVLDSTQGIIDFFNKLPQSVKVGTAVFLTLVAVLGPLLLIFGALAGAVAALGTSLGTLALAFGAVSASIGTLVAFQDPLFKFLTGVDGALQRAADETFQRTLADPILGAVVQGTENALLELDRFKSDVIRKQAELASGLKDTKLPLFDSASTEKELTTLVEQSKELLDQQASARLEGLAALRDTNSITEDEYTRFVDATRAKLGEAKATQDSFLGDYTKWAEDVAEAGSNIDVSGLEILFRNQREASIKELSQTQEESVAILQNLNQEARTIANVRLGQVISEQRALSEATVAGYLDTYDKTKALLKDALASEDEITRTAAEDRLNTMAVESQKQIAASAKTYFDLVQLARNEAIAEGGVYDAKHDRILTGAKAFFFVLGQGAKVGFGAFLEGVVAFGTLFITIFTTIFSSAISVASDFFNKISNSYNAFKNGSLKEAAASLAAFGNFNSLGEEIAANFQKGFSTIATGFDNMDKGIDETTQKFREATGNLSLEEVTQNFIDAAKSGDSLTESLDGASVGADNFGASAQGAGGASKKTSDRVKELEKSLQDLGAFSITEGGKVVDSFSSIEDGAKKVGDRLQQLDQNHTDFLETLSALASQVSRDLGDLSDKTDSIQSVFNDLASGASTTEKSISRLKTLVTTYDDVESAVKYLGDAVNDIEKVHQDFVANAEKGLLGLGDTVDQITKKYDELIKTATERASEGFISDYSKSLEEQKSLTEELAKLNADLSEAQAKGDAERASSIQNDIIQKNADIKANQEQIDSFQSFLNNTKDYTAQVDAAKAKVAELVAKNDALVASGESNVQVAKDLQKAQTDLYLLLGKQDLAQKGLEDLKQKAYEEELKNSLTQAEFDAYQHGQALAQIEEKRNAEIASAQDVAAVQAAIAGKTSDQLTALGFAQDFIDEVEAIKKALADATDPATLQAGLEGLNLSQDALDLATKAQTDLEEYKNGLIAQQAILTEFQNKEVAIYASTREELKTQQDSLEEYLTLSYDRLILKLEAMKAAAEAAALAGAAVSGASSVPTVPFANGGFTAEGPAHQVAGVVHKGEWVAPKWMVQQFSPVISALEKMRSGKAKGFEAGGFTSPTVPQYNQTITNHIAPSNPMDLKQFSGYLAWQLRTL